MAAWFGEFIQRYNLGRTHLDHDTVLDRTGGRQAAMNAGPTAEWLLREWDAEQPEHASQNAA